MRSMVLIRREARSCPSAGTSFLLLMEPRRRAKNKERSKLRSSVNSACKSGYTPAEFMLVNVLAMNRDDRLAVVIHSPFSIYCSLFDWQGRRQNVIGTNLVLGRGARTGHEDISSLSQICGASHRMIRTRVTQYLLTHFRILCFRILCYRSIRLIVLP